MKHLFSRKRKGQYAIAKWLMSLDDIFTVMVVVNFSSSTLIFFFVSAAGRFLSMVWLSPKHTQKSV